MIAPAHPTESLPASASDLFQRLAPAVARIETYGPEASPARDPFEETQGSSAPLPERWRAVLGQGSGFFVSADGLVVTNNHVIAGADTADVILPTNARFPVQSVMAQSTDDDIAILKVDATGMPTLAVSDSAPPLVGTTVYAIGNPRGLTNSFSRGEISGLRTLSSAVSLLQCTTPISPGSSGGPLISTKGEVIGMTSSYLAGGQNLNFAVPAKRVRRLLQGELKARPFREASGNGDPVVGLLREVELPRWARDVPYEARMNLVVSAKDAIRWVLEGYFNRELRRIAGVVITDDKAHWKVSVVAIAQEEDGRRVAYWMSVVVTEIDGASERVAKHQLLMRGIDVLESGVRDFVAEMEGELVEPDRRAYEELRELARAGKQPAPR
jgi:hypothetical protein